MIEKNGFGDKAFATWHTNGKPNETVGIEGWYHVECRDAQGNLKWTEDFPNLDRKSTRLNSSH